MTSRTTPSRVPALASWRTLVAQLVPVPFVLSGALDWLAAVAAYSIEAAAIALIHWWRLLRRPRHLGKQPLLRNVLGIGALLFGASAYGLLSVATTGSEDPTGTWLYAGLTAAGLLAGIALGVRSQGLEGVVGGPGDAVARLVLLWLAGVVASLVVTRSGELPGLLPTLGFVLVVALLETVLAPVRPEERRVSSR